MFFCKKWKLNVNTEKTKIMIFNKSGRLLKSNKFTFFNKIPLEAVQEFRYLGVIIKASHSGTFTKGITELNNKALKVVFMIRKKIQSSHIFPSL